MSEQDALARLAAAVGIEDGWWDFYGEWRDVAADTKRAFLAGMGFAVEDEAAIERSLAAFEEAPWRRWLEPVTVARQQDGPACVTLTLPEPLDAGVLDWTLTEEMGAVHKGQLRPWDLPFLEERWIGGVKHLRRAFQLPGEPGTGYHRLALAAGGQRAEAELIVTPATAWRQPELDQGAGLWGIATQLYALRSPEDFGVGDYGALKEMGLGAAKLGAASLGVNPLHALFPMRPDRFSPYSPSSRSFLNVTYLDVRRLPDFQESLHARRLYASPGFQQRLGTARNQAQVDYDTVAALKMTLLEECYKSFRQTHLAEDAETERGQAFRAFQAEGGMVAERFCTFEALTEHFLRQDVGLAYWRHWPEDYRHPESEAVQAFAQKKRERVEFFWYLQWMAEQQLAEAHGAMIEAGMPVGLYRDLGVGIAGDGAEAWAEQGLLASGVGVGAPPDPLAPNGQDWGLVPYNPVALREAGYKPFIRMLAANMRSAGALRLDHAMSLQRLYWVPNGVKADQGAYVRYPIDDLMALVALESRRNRCLVIGEDLGTVAEGFRERMAETDLFGYRVLVFERQDGGAFKAPAAYQPASLVMPGTHDLPSLRGWWTGIDLDAREKLDLYPRAEMALQEREARERDRALLVEALAAEGLLPEDFPVGPNLSGEQCGQLAVAVHGFLARAGSRLMMVQLEDVLCLSLQMNLPGTTTQHPNWRVRLPLETPDILGDARVQGLAGLLQERRPPD